MQRIPALLKKLADLSEKESLSAIDIDLMLDYTRVLYADLLDRRNQAMAQAPVPRDIPSLNEVAATFSAHAETPAPAPLPVPEPSPEVDGNPALSAADIRELVSVNDKYQFITELFQGNRSAYEKVMENLNKFETAIQAQNWLHSRVFNQYSWDEDSDVVQIFYDIVNQFFANR